MDQRGQDRAPEASLARALVAAPRPDRPDLAAERVADWRAALPDGHRLEPLLAEPGVPPLLDAVADHSPYLWRLVRTDPTTLDRATADAERVAEHLTRDTSAAS